MRWVQIWIEEVLQDFLLWEHRVGHWLLLLLRYIFSLNKKIWERSS